MSETAQPGAESVAPEPSYAPDPAPAPEPSPPPSDAPITAREAGNLISEQSDTEPAPRPEPGGETEASEPAEPPPLVPPRSWSKEDKDAFRLLPHEAQERILARDREREAEIQRGLREAAEQRKAVEAMAQQTEQAQQQARQQYQQTLPQKALLLDAQYRQEFGTPTWDQIQEWSQYDQPKYVRWQAAYARATAAADELKQQRAQQAQAQQQEWQLFQRNAEAWKAEETEKFQEAVPEWKDPKTYGTKVAEVLEHMEEIGFTRDEINRFANEFAPIQVHDHRFQKLVWNSLLHKKAINAAKQPARRPVPPVQRPGPAPSRGEANETRLRDLNRTLDRTGEARDAARLIAALNGR